MVEKFDLIFLNKRLIKINVLMESIKIIYHTSYFRKDN